MIGRTIGNYVVQRKIGQGGMGAVYLAEHPRIRRQVAIKVLLPEFGRDAQVVARFFNEAKAANEIRNEHIIDILDFGELPDDGSSYIIMEWLDGHSLSEVLGENERLHVTRAIHVARGIGRALASAHKHGIVHRDLKPDNIFLIQRAGDPDFVKVLDFGIAKLTQGDKATEIKTQTGAIIGTPSFMSPEQCRGLPVDARTDIYALGCICYRMLTGVLPFAAEGLGELLLQHMTQPPAPLRQHDATIPAAVELAVMRALEKEPAKRFPAVEDFLSAMSDVQTGAMRAIGDDGLPVTTVHAASMSTGQMSRSTNLDTLGAAAGQSIDPTLAPKRKPIMLVGGLALLAGFGVTAFLLTRPKPTPPAPIAQPTPTPAPAPVAAVVPPPAPAPTPAPAAPAPAAPSDKVLLTIRTIPPGAHVSIDEGKVPNPFEGTFKKDDVRHRVTVKAPGYRTESQWVMFDADQALEIAMVRGSGTHESVAHKPASARPAAPILKPAAPAVAPAPAPAPVAVKADPPKVEDKPENKNEKPVYKGTKGKLITDFPEN